MRVYVCSPREVWPACASCSCPAQRVHCCALLPGQVLDASTVAAEDTFTYALVMDEAEPPLVGFNNGVAATRLHLG